MYKMSHYTDASRNELLAFMKEHPLATVCGTGNQYPVASHLPLMIKEEGEKLFLAGHLMRKTDHHLGFEKNNRVIAIFQSAYAFIDANWYAQSSIASTVNYMAVHAKGWLHFLDEMETYESIKELTRNHIKAGSPAAFENLPADYIVSNLKAIIGFRIEVETLDHVFKLSQNRTVTDQKNIIQQLRQRNLPGDVFIANAMEKRIP